MGSIQYWYVLTSFSVGNVPVQMFAKYLSFGIHLLPHGKSLSSFPDLHANSHSASVGNLLPTCLQYATASFQETWTTGCDSRPSAKTSLSGPSGWRQLAPLTGSHQGASWTAWLMVDLVCEKNELIFFEWTSVPQLLILKSKMHKCI